MLNLIGPRNDNFALFATPAHGGIYKVAILCDRPEPLRELSVPAIVFSSFAAARMHRIEFPEETPAVGVFMAALTAEDIQELANRAKLAGNPCEILAHAA